MKLIADFKPETPVIANVGIWDPFMSEHARMFADLRAAAEARGHLPCALLLDPPPSRFIAGRPPRPLFDDVVTRIERIRECGVQVAVIEFEEPDLKAGVREFLDLIGEWCTLSSLWLGPTQSLGSGPEGSALAIETETQRRAIELYRMPVPKQQTSGSYAKNYLAHGKVRDAAGAMGRLPVRNRTSSTEVETCWLEGRYHVLLTRRGILQQQRSTIDMNARNSGPVTFTWPAADVERIIFVSGPGDGARVQPAADNLNRHVVQP